ncbi:hypothetical protein BDZ89DRAFT_1158307 [Hymenopellis radicata]|nr:hypothetical protein BDZ89DRAFT_1158307 [Hymenopellis radicata]
MSTTPSQPQSGSPSSSTPKLRVADVPPAEVEEDNDSDSESDSDWEPIRISTPFSPTRPSSIHVTTMTTSISAKAPPERKDESDEEEEAPFTPRLSSENPAAVRVSRTHSVSDSERVALPMFGMDTPDPTEESIRKEAEECARLSPVYPAEVQVTRNIVVEWIEDVDCPRDSSQEDETWHDEEHSSSSWSEEEMKEARREEQQWERWP